ncbi:septal ring lytic transglycosylase RlpA family protein [Flavobacterium silvisoli]|uniref:Probable endolytic peptidoglycan transglycosylase RlpA n=1 Tax=Flavobacterium silvisoli TaxID=2529433 RepID=A0A4Q9Z8K8_9FLAO|nr:septal ring lytic transglycosylase RlpA family protein [Flavobacterium silvisoli]TBX71077.1 septal ring lytic transglycosylase RlpA family protein [Flavobacterium silvisoli]
MNTKIVPFFSSLVLLIFSASLWATNPPQQKEKNKPKAKETAVAPKESKDKTKAATLPLTKVDTLKNKALAEIPQVTDSLKTEMNLKFKFYKKNAHASYYAQKFHGKRTASGIRFDNTKYTAAHKKLPFGTKVKVTNEANGKSVIVEITDRGPFSKVREIDLSKKAFMELVDNKNSGAVIVKLEVEDK